MELYLKNWYAKFFDELTLTTKLRVVSSFVKEQVIRKMDGQFDFNNFELIFRFNLRDFASNVSSLDGLKFLGVSGATVLGIRELHSKSTSLTTGQQLLHQPILLQADWLIIMNVEFISQTQQLFKTFINISTN